MSKRAIERRGEAGMACRAEQVYPPIRLDLRPFSLRFLLSKHTET